MIDGSHLKRSIAAKRAEECEDEARRAPSSSIAHTWLDLARQWREMANRIDKDRAR